MVMGLALFARVATGLPGQERRWGAYVAIVCLLLVMPSSSLALTDAPAPWLRELCNRDSGTPTPEPGGCPCDFAGEELNQIGPLQSCSAPDQSFFSLVGENGTLIVNVGLRQCYRRDAVGFQDGFIGLSDAALDACLMLLGQIAMDNEVTCN